MYKWNRPRQHEGPVKTHAGPATRGSEGAIFALDWSPDGKPSQSRARSEREHLRPETGLPLASCTGHAQAFIRGVFTGQGTWHRRIRRSRPFVQYERLRVGKQLVPVPLAEVRNDVAVVGVDLFRRRLSQP